MPELDLHYVDPRLVAQYDTDNAGRHDTDFYLHLATELKARKVIDLGAGTGVLARDMAAAGREVWAVDPATEMLTYARKQPGADRVTWVNADASGIGDWGADLAVMTGNVAQVFLNDDDWLSTLRHLHAGLRPGGHLAFESRNPLARAWEEWTPENTRGVTQTPHGPLESWLEVQEVRQGKVRMVGRNVFHETGERLDVPSTLRFRTHQEITASLEEAEFKVQEVYGSWLGESFQSDSRVMIFLARRA